MVGKPKWWAITPDVMLAGEMRRVRRRPASTPECERVRIRGTMPQPENTAFNNIRKEAARQQGLLLRQLLAEDRLLPPEIPAYARERIIGARLGLTALQVRRGLEIACAMSHDGLL